MLVAFVLVAVTGCCCTLLLADGDDEGSRDGAIGILLPRADLSIVVVPWVWLVY